MKKNSNTNPMVISWFIKSRKLTFLILIVSLLLACKHNQHPVIINSGKVKDLLTTKVVKKDISAGITMPGEILPFQEVELYPKVSGFVKEVMVDRGDIVKKGQLLLVMEAPEIQQQLILAQSKLLETQSVMNLKKERFQMLSVTSQTPGSVSPYDLESAKSEYESAEASVLTEKANVAAFQAMNDYLRIQAPFNGVITQRNVHPGAFIGPASQFKEPVLILKQTDRLRLTVYVPEVYVNFIDLQSDVSFTLNAVPNKEFHGKISRTSHSVNLQSRSEALEIDIFNQKEIKPGMYADVRLPVISGEGNTFTVPYSAVLTSTERKYVIVVTEKHRAHLVDVIEGITDGKTTEVYGSLKENMEVITKPDLETEEGDLLQ